jgi:hypothetical protein
VGGAAASQQRQVVVVKAAAQQIAHRRAAPFQAPPQRHQDNAVCAQGRRFCPRPPFD